MESPESEPEFLLRGFYVQKVGDQYAARACPACNHPLYFDGDRERCVNETCTSDTTGISREGSFLFSLLNYPQRFAHYLLRFGLNEGQSELGLPTTVVRLSALYMAGLSLGLTCARNFDQTFASCFDGLATDRFQRATDGRLQLLGLAWGRPESAKKMASQLNTTFLFVLTTKDHDSFLIEHTGSFTPGPDDRVTLTDLSALDASLYFAEGMLFAKNYRREAEDLAKSDIALVNKEWPRIEDEPGFDLVRHNAPLFADEKDLFRLSEQDFKANGPSLEGSFPYILRLFILYTLHLRWNLSRW